MSDDVQDWRAVLDGRREWAVVLGDCLDVLRELPAGSVDAVATDPPYGIAVGAAFVRRAGRHVDDGAGGWNENMSLEDWMPRAAVTIAPGGHLATFIKRQDVPIIGAIAEACELDWWHSYYIIKNAPPPTPRPTFVSAVEVCAIFARTGGRRRWFGTGYEPNRWCGLTPNRRNEGIGHPTQKPIEPIAQLVRCLSPIDGIVADPFTGSGTTGVACLQTGRRFIGVEIDPTYHAIAVERLTKAAAARQPMLAGFEVTA